MWFVLSKVLFSCAMCSLNSFSSSVLGGGVSDYKYLGYIFNEHLNQKSTVKTLTLSANRAFGWVVTIFKKRGNLGYKTYITLYNTYTLPILNYASGVWGSRNRPSHKYYKTGYVISI